MSEKPCSQMKSDIPVIAAAKYSHFASDWESELYHIILRVLRRSTLDESVPVGMVVLLDLLADVYKMGMYTAGDECELTLAPYPHNEYIGYAMAAFMLSYRLLSKERPVEEGFWEHVMDDVITPDKVHALENEFRTLLERKSKRYPPPPISPEDPAYKFYYAGDLPVPPNSLIIREKYLRTKWTMYSHIRLAMNQRGEETLEVDPRTDFKHKDLLLQFPPCDDYIMHRSIIFQQTRSRVPELWEASNREVHNYLEVERRQSEERTQSARTSDALLGLGLLDALNLEA